MESETKHTALPSSSYATLLNKFNLTYTEVSPYLQVGQVTPAHGLQIHLSAIIGQVANLLETVIPVLIAANVPFQIIADQPTAKSILNGFIGISELAKVVKIYVAEQHTAQQLATQLVNVTASFYGPVVTGDIGLNDTVYVPVQQANLYGSMVQWPVASGKIINGKYRIKEVIKADVKGSVMKAFYVKGFLNIGSCIIKQGKKAMWADEHGQDIGHRLQSQHRIHQDLKGIINIPAVIDFFTYNGDTYFAMEYIKGVSLENRIIDIYQGRHWKQLSSKEQHTIVNYLLLILGIVNQLHQKGYVHRDLTPANFILNKKDQIYLIDMEMAYHISAIHPAFTGGTEGFMSIEQFNDDTPSFTDDVYGFGALVLFAFSNLPPLKFNRDHRAQLSQSLQYFIDNESLANTIAKCFASPKQRPSFKQLAAELAKFRMTLADVKATDSIPVSNKQSIQALIATAINGLTLPQFATTGQMFGASRQAEYGVSNIKYVRFAASGILCPITGILGILPQQDEDIHNIVADQMSYFEDHFLKRYHPEQHGLLSGNAGLALTLGYALKAKLLLQSKYYTDYIQQCFLTDAKTLVIAEGIAGQGLAWIYLKDYIQPDLFAQKLQHYLTLVLQQQTNKGSWSIASIPEEQRLTLGLAMGQAGIVLFLLECYQLHADPGLKQAIDKALGYIKSQTSTVKDDYTMFYGNTGIAFIHIRAYQYFKTAIYKQAAEKALAVLPAFKIPVDYSFALGLTGLGLVYIEAAKALNDAKWKNAATWVANLYQATFHQITPDQGYWNVDGMDNYDSGFLTGTTGIVYFLQRYISLIATHTDSI